MITEEYKKALVEVLEIINRLEESEKKKIPREIMEFYEINKSKTYEPHLNLDKDISKISIMSKTSEILAGIYIDYLCDNEEEKQSYINKLRQIEERAEAEKREKYNPDTIFENRKPPVQEDKSMIVTQKQSFFSKILEKIKTLFKK